MHRSIALFVTTFLLAKAVAFDPSVTINPAAAFKTSITTTVTTTTTIAPNSTTIAPNSTTIAPNSTTIAPNSTTIAPNSTTIAPNSTTIAPNSTTTAPNSTTTAPNSTTPAPTTAGNVTTTPTTTTMLPTPTPVVTPTQGDYQLGNGTETCVRIKAVIEIFVNNSDAVGVFIVQPNETKPTGNCDNHAAHIELNFNEGFIQLNFLKKDSTVFVNYIEAKLEYAFKSGTRNNFTVSNNTVQLFSMGAGHSYSCSSDNIFMGKGIQLKFSQLRLQAFDFHNADFGQPDICKIDQPNYRVAIAVGVVLIILIIIVVAVYLISRKRRTDGYQSL